MKHRRLRQQVRVKVWCGQNWTVTPKAEPSSNSSVLPTTCSCTSTAVLYARAYLTSSQSTWKASPLLSAMHIPRIFSRRSSVSGAGFPLPGRCTRRPHIHGHGCHSALHTSRKDYPRHLSHTTSPAPKVACFPPCQPHPLPTPHPTTPGKRPTLGLFYLLGTLFGAQLQYILFVVNF